jgi:hypothetical protein
MVLPTGERKMVRQRTDIGKILFTVVVVLLLCGIVTGEFPELQTLTDNATNDFTVLRTKSAASPVRLVARKRRPVSDADSGTFVPTLLFSHACQIEKEAFVRSGAFVLHGILRT